MTFILSVAELAAISGQLCGSPHSLVIHLGEKVFKAQFEQ